MALSAPRNTKAKKSGYLHDLPAKGSTIVYEGALCVLDSAGLAVPATTATGKLGLGRAVKTVDNSGGSNATLRVVVQEGIFKWDNDATNPFSQGNVGSIAYAVDDMSVGTLASGHSPVGVAIQLDSDGVYVDTSLAVNKAL